MKIEKLKTVDIKPYFRNPRKNDDAVEGVAESIQAFGFQNPIILDKDNVIIAGHTRWKAALKLDLKELPCIIADLPEEYVKAYRIADNKYGEKSEWDFALLKDEFEDLDTGEFDLELTGFDMSEIEEMMTKYGDEYGTDFTLPDGDRDGLQQMTFILADEQVENVKTALAKSKKQGDFIDTGNENSNGNALARICETYNG